MNSSPFSVGTLSGKLVPWGKMGKFTVKRVGLKIFTSLAKVVVHDFPLTTTAQTTFFDVANVDLSFQGLPFSDN